MAVPQWHPRSQKIRLEPDLGWRRAPALPRPRHSSPGPPSSAWPRPSWRPEPLRRPPWWWRSASTEISEKKFRTKRLCCSSTSGPTWRTSCCCSWTKRTGCRWSPGSSRSHLEFKKNQVGWTTGKAAEQGPAIFPPLTLGMSWNRPRPEPVCPGSLLGPYYICQTPIKPGPICSKTRELFWQRLLQLIWQ